MLNQIAAGQSKAFKDEIGVLINESTITLSTGVGLLALIIAQVLAWICIFFPQHPVCWRKKKIIKNIPKMLLLPSPFFAVLH